MGSVSARIKAVKQPRGGYVKPSLFDVEMLDDGRELSAAENVHSSIVGTVVDYMARVSVGMDPWSAFDISLRGAKAAEMFGIAKAEAIAEFLLLNIVGLDDDSIISACKLVTFDTWYRNPGAAMLAKGMDDVNPDEATMRNIRVMAYRAISFFEKYGPVAKYGFTFGPGGYTKTVSSGDGDFLTKDTLWDFKVSVNKPTSKHTLQLLMYWIMGQHSGLDEFKDIINIGIFNPRLNAVYTLPIAKIDSAVISAVETDVICY